MFAGHIGVALAIGRAERRVNVGTFVAAALLLDILLWPFILFGWESVFIPGDFGATHQPEFVFPYSHSLLAAGMWSVLAGAVAARFCARNGVSARRIAALAATAVFSHWVLDALVHRPEMPIAGAGSAVVGMALWNHMSVSLVGEAALVALGLWLFLPGSGLSHARAGGITALSVGILAFTVVGMTIAPPPPSAAAMAASSLLALAVVCALFGWLGRLSHHRQA